MQLKPKSVSKTLSAATCALLGVPSLAAQASGLDDGARWWEAQAALLFYQESDGRVRAIEPAVSLRARFGEDSYLNLKLVVDSLTGSTPNGATPSSGAPQTFTSPSGAASYTAAAGETPLDNSFLDTRIAGSASWEQPLGENMRGTIGANVSTEYDFLSVGGNLSLSRDFNQRNTTVTAGLSLEHDMIKPVGGVPIPFAAMGIPGGIQPRQGSDDTRTVIDGILGLTQVINRRTLMQFNYSLSLSDGYHTDPYKIITEVVASGAATGTYFFENRPGDRMRHSLFWRTKYSLDRDIIDASYRFYIDDWGILSHTLDLRYRWRFSDKQYLEPLFRFYHQSEADFYQVNILAGAPLPTNASADYRLASFNAYTIGLKYGLQLPFGDMSVRLDYYLQSGDDSPDSAIGLQRGLDIFPDMNALMAQVIFTY